MSTSSSSLVVKSHTSLVHSTYGTCEKISHCFRFLLFPGIHVIIPCDLTHWNLPAGVSNTSWAICHIHTVTFAHVHTCIFCLDSHTNFLLESCVFICCPFKVSLTETWQRCYNRHIELFKFLSYPPSVNTHTGTHTHKSSVLQCYSQIPQTLFWCLWSKENGNGAGLQKTAAVNRCS